MDNEFLEYYQDNLQFFRQLGNEFSREFPKIANRLEFMATNCQDPYVERLLEGAAFLAARVEKKLDDGNMRLLESLLSTAAPQLLAPVPSFAVIQLRNLDMSIAQKCPELPLLSQFRVPVAESKTNCIFSSICPLTVYPVNLKRALYLTRDLSAHGIDAPSGLAWELELTAPLPPGDDGDLLVYLDLNGDDCSELLCQLQVDLKGVYVEGDAPDAPWQIVEGISFEQPVFDSSKIPPVLTVQNHGLGLISLAGNFPHFMHFVRIRGFRKLLQQAHKGTLRFAAAFSRRVDSLAHGLMTENFRLNCIPVINLLKKRSDRQPLSLNHEHHIVPDRTAPLDYEIFRIENLTLYDSKNQKLETLRNAYLDYTDEGQGDHSSIFCAHREPRICHSEGEQKSSYAGSEVYVSLSSPFLEEYLPDELSISAETFCTNRDLPLRIIGQNELIPVEKCAAAKAGFVTLPTRPRNSIYHNISGELWQKMSALTLHFSILLWQDHIELLRLLRELMRLHSTFPDEDTRMMLNGLRKITREPKTFRFLRDGCFYGESGWKLTAELDEQSFVGLGYYRAGCLLRELLFNYFPINVHVEFELRTIQQGRITSWLK